MDKQGVYDFLREQGIPFEAAEHPAVFTMEEAEALNLPHPESDAKNLFVRDAKHRQFYLITVRGDRRVDLKDFRRRHGLPQLSFASAEELSRILGLIPGSVTPLGILNDGERRVEFWLDAYFLQPPALVGVHPNDNTATVWLKAEDLLAILRGHGNAVYTAEME